MTSRTKKENLIGERLRKARQDKGISLEEANRITKILPKIIEALEEDRLEEMLGKAYARSFLKTYAEYLGFELKDIIQQYAPARAPANRKNPILNQGTISKEKEQKIKQTAVAAIVFIAVFLIVGFVVKSIGRYMQARKDKVIASESAKSKEVSGKVPAKKSSRRTAREQSSTRDVKSGPIPIPKRSTILLTMLTKKDVWLKITQDGEVAFHGILSKNSKETWEAKKEIRLFEIGRPEALKLIVNGKEIDFSGRRLGRSILITRKGVTLESK